MPNISLEGKVVFIAGGSSGINLGIAQHFSRAGAKIAIISRSAEKLEAAASSIADQGGEVIVVPTDVRDYERVEEALLQTATRFGEIDIVISGAAGNFLAPALALSANAFKTVIDIDLLGTFNVLRASYAYLRKPGASLISISAPQGAQPKLFQAHACAAKAGINMLTKCLAMEWGPAGVRVNAISPGPIAGTEGVARLADVESGATEGWKARLALRRFGQSSDIAALAQFLSSEAGSFITGAIVDCDGGSGLGDASGDALTIPER